MSFNHEAGKGSKQRPTDYEKFSNNWDMIFANKPNTTEPQSNHKDQPKTGDLTTTAQQVDTRTL